MSDTQISEAFRAWPRIEPAVFVPHSEEQYNQLVKLLDHLIDEIGENEEHPLASLMEVVGVLIEKYEDDHVPVLREK